MIRKIALAFLLFCVAFPAVAAPLCHGPVAAITPLAVSHHAMAMTDHGAAPTGDHRHQSGDPQHLCIGCIAFAKDMATATTAPLLTTMPSLLPAAELVAIHAPPRLRPPQS